MYKCMQAPSAMNTPERLTTDQARSQNTGFGGKRHFWRRDRELELGKAKTHKFVLWLLGHLVLLSLVLQLLNGMRNSF